MVRPKSLRQLGISLIGSTIEPSQPVASTSFQDGAEAPAQQAGPPEEALARHFVHKVLPDGLFSNLNCLKPGDELLQVRFNLFGQQIVLAELISGAELRGGIRCYHSKITKWAFDRPNWWLSYTRAHLTLRLTNRLSLPAM